MAGLPVTVGTRLERDRLQARAAPRDRVVMVLRARAREYEEGATPTPTALKHSLADFQRELAAVRARLHRDAG
jgi:hypothetical protein